MQTLSQKCILDMSHDTADRETIGDLPPELSEPDEVFDGNIETYNFEDGESRQLFGERILSDGRVATMAGPSFLSPNVGDEGEHVALRYYRHRLLCGEVYLHVEDVIRVSKRYKNGEAVLENCHFPGTLSVEKRGNVLRVRKAVNAEDHTATAEVELTKTEMTRFARAVAQVIQNR